MTNKIIPFELEKSWETVLKDELSAPYMLQLKAFLEQERALGREVYPPQELMFNAFRFTPYSEVKVVIMGQDPYHGRGQAHGLSFSVPPGVNPPPSLQNIFKEIHQDLNLPIPKQGCLIPWAKQGVLMLNAVLTVTRGEPLSHQKKGWEKFTDAVIAKVAQKTTPVVFILWGKSAQEKALSVLNSISSHQPHLILKAAHPSPYSAHNGFFGCRHFSKTNAFLEQHSLMPIDWSLP